MSSFVIFDPKNNLIFSKCDDTFRKILLEINNNNNSNDDDDDNYVNKQPESNPEDENDYQEIVHNWLAIYLTPYVSMFRESSQEGDGTGFNNIEFDLIPSTLIVHKNYQEFLFMNLICRQHQHRLQAKAKNTDDDVGTNDGGDGDDDDLGVDESTSVILHQFKVNIFCQSVIFLCGNAFYFVARNEAIQQTLFEMIDKWNMNRSKVSFIIESIEKLYIGYHIAQICEELAFKFERILKLEMKTLNKEIFSFCFIMYRNKLVHKFESNTRVRLKPRDLTMIMLLTQLINDHDEKDDAQQQSNSIGDRHDYHSRRMNQFLIAKQKLVFLQSSSQIPIPHIFRKILINQDLCIVCLSELSSILMISLPTLIHSVINYKTNMLNVKHNSKRSIDYLIKCIKSMDKYINKNLDALSQRHLFNMSSLENLNQLAKKAHSRRNSQTDYLIQEQTDRIFTVLMDSLYQSYEKVFKSLYDETIENHFKPFHKLTEKNLYCMNSVKKLNNCLDFINLKYLKNITLLDNLQALQVYSNLLAFIFVDRIDNFFLEDHREFINDDIDTLYLNLVLKAYRQVMKFNKNIVFWSDERFFYIYACWSHSLMSLKEKIELEEETNLNITDEKNLKNIQIWPNLFIDEWFQKKNVFNEFFAIVDLKKLNNYNESNNIINNNNDIVATRMQEIFWLNYLTNIVNKIKTHIEFPL